MVSGREEARPWRAPLTTAAVALSKLAARCVPALAETYRLASPLRVCPCTPSPQTSRCTRCRDVRVPDPAHVQRDTASDGMTRVWTQPKWRSQQQRRVRLAGQGRRAFISATRVRIPHTTPSTEVLALTNRDDCKPAATIGRHRNPSPEPCCEFSFASLTQWSECRPV